MAKNSDKRTPTRKERIAARQEAERLQAEQERKEHIIQTAIGVVVVAVIAAIIGVAGFFIVRNYIGASQSSQQQSAQAAKTADEAYTKLQAVKVKPENAAQDGGFIISKNGVNKPIDGIPTVEEYMDFICPACGTMNRSTDAVITKMVDAGQINFSVHPAAFLNNSSTDRYSSRSAAFVAYVLDNEPTKGLELIKKLFSEGTQPQEASNYKSVSNDDLVKIAKSVGVSDSVAEEAAKGTYTEWVDAVSSWYPYREELWNPSGTYAGSMTTPTLRINESYWDYNTIASSTGSTDYGDLLVKSLGLNKSDVGNADVKSSIGTGKPAEVTTK